MGDGSVAAAVEDWEGAAHARGDVVGIENGESGGFAQAIRAHHADVHPWDHVDAGAAVRRAHHWPDDAAAREEGDKMGCHADGANAGATAAVGNAEGLVEVEVADIGTDVAGAGQTDLGVHVGSVHVDLATVAMDHCADVCDGFLEHAMGGGVGDHEGSEAGSMFSSAGREVGGIDVSVGIAFHGDNLHARHDGARRVGAMGADRNEADIAVQVAAAAVPSANRQKSRVFALTPSVGSHRNGCQSGDVGEPRFELTDHGGGTFLLAGWGEGVHGGDFGP